MANPERIDSPFLRAMVETGVSAWDARNQFEDHPTGPVWSFDRRGRAMVTLPDGRTLHVGGEHVDGCGRDFCIYNDVVARNPDGSFEIYGYPRDVFPPTCFHSATYAKGFVYLIGCLGHGFDRRPGRTPVYRLDAATLAIERLNVTGDGPGWISQHHTKRVGGTAFGITGGQVWTGDDLVPNTARFRFDGNTGVFSRLD